MIRVIALSCGPDSMALLHSLDKTNLVACHYNHKWSYFGDDSQKFVQTICNKLNVPVFVGENTTDNKTETGGRDLRYEYFTKVCNQLGASTLYMAHHLDDQVETILHRMCRGTGLQGLQGIPEQRDLYPGCTIQRPFLDKTKFWILDYCSKNNLQYLNDPSNKISDNPRNLIRNEIIPLLDKVHPGAREAIHRLSVLAKQDSELIGVMLQKELTKLNYNGAADWWSIDYKQFMKLDKLVRDRIWVDLDKGPMSARRLEIVNESLATKTRRDLAGGWTIRYSGDYIVMSKDL